MGACVSAPTGDNILPNPGKEGAWKVAIVPIGSSKTEDCYINKNSASGPKWLYLRREATQASSAASYFLESFVPDAGRFPDAKSWKRGNGTVLCAAKANELGPSCFTMEEWPITLPSAAGQSPDSGEYSSDDAEMRKEAATNPAVVIQRAKWTLKAEAYIYEDAGMRQQAGTLHMRAFGKQFRRLFFIQETSDSGAIGGTRARISFKVSGIKYYYTPKDSPDAMIPISYKGRMLRCPRVMSGGGISPTISSVDRVPPSLAFNGPIFNANVPSTPFKPREIEGLASGIPPAVGMMIAYLATTALGPEAIIQNIPVFRFPAVHVPRGGLYAMEMGQPRRADPPTPLMP